MRRELGKTTRRALLTTLAAALAAGAAGLGVDARAEVDERNLEPRNMPVRALLPNGGRFHPRTIVVLHDGGVRVGALPRRARALPDSRLDLSGVRLAGPLFRDRPFHTFLRPENRVGVLGRVGDRLVVDLRRAPLGARDVRRLLNRPTTILTKPNRVNKPFSITLNVAYNAARAPVSVDDAPLIGHVYLAGDQLLLSPPYETFYGHRLFH